MKRAILLWSMTGAAMFAQQQTMEKTLAGNLSGRWWNDDAIVQRLGITAEQRKQMDTVFQEHRLKLIDLTAELEKEETILVPMVEAVPPDASRIRTQIGIIADARAALERTNGEMLLGIRLVLTPAQWNDLRTHGIGPRAARVHKQ